MNNKNYGYVTKNQVEDFTETLSSKTSITRPKSVKGPDYLQNKILDDNKGSRERLMSGIELNSNSNSFNCLKAQIEKNQLHYNYGKNVQSLGIQERLYLSDAGQEALAKQDLLKKSTDERSRTLERKKESKIETFFGGGQQWQSPFTQKIESRRIYAKGINTPHYLSLEDSLKAELYKEVFYFLFQININSLYQKEQVNGYGEECQAIKDRIKGVEDKNQNILYKLGYIDGEGYRSLGNVGGTSSLQNSEGGSKNSQFSGGNQRIQSAIGSDQGQRFNIVQRAKVKEFESINADKNRNIVGWQVQKVIGQMEKKYEKQMNELGKALSDETQQVKLLEEKVERLTIENSRRSSKSPVEKLPEFSNFFQRLRNILIYNNNESDVSIKELESSKDQRRSGYLLKGEEQWILEAVRALQTREQEGKKDIHRIEQTLLQELRKKAEQMSILEEEKIKMKEEIEFAKMKKEEGRVNTSGSVMTMTPFGRMSEQSIFRGEMSGEKKKNSKIVDEGEKRSRDDFEENWRSKFEDMEKKNLFILQKNKEIGEENKNLKDKNEQMQEQFKIINNWMAMSKWEQLLPDVKLIKGDINRTFESIIDEVKKLRLLYGNFESQNQQLGEQREELAVGMSGLAQQLQEKENEQQEYSQQLNNVIEEKNEMKVLNEELVRENEEIKMNYEQIKKEYEKLKQSLEVARQSLNQVQSQDQQLRVESVQQSQIINNLMNQNEELKQQMQGLVSEFEAGQQQLEWQANNNKKIQESMEMQRQQRDQEEIDQVLALKEEIKDANVRNAQIQSNLDLKEIMIIKLSERAEELLEQAKELEEKKENKLPPATNNHNEYLEINNQNMNEIKQELLGWKENFEKAQKQVEKNIENLITNNQQKIEKEHLMKLQLEVAQIKEDNQSIRSENISLREENLEIRKENQQLRQQCKQIEDHIQYEREQNNQIILDKEKLIQKDREIMDSHKQLREKINQEEQKRKELEDQWSQEVKMLKVEINKVNEINLVQKQENHQLLQVQSSLENQLLSLQDREEARKKEREMLEQENSTLKEQNENLSYQFEEMQNIFTQIQQQFNFQQQKENHFSQIIDLMSLSVSEIPIQNSNNINLPLQKTNIDKKQATVLKEPKEQIQKNIQNQEEEEEEEEESNQQLNKNKMRAQDMPKQMNIQQNNVIDHLNQMSQIDNNELNNEEDEFQYVEEEEENEEIY